LSFLPGNLSIAPVAATVTANSATKQYTGQSQFVTGYTATGLVNGDKAPMLSALTATAVGAMNLGSYNSTMTGSKAENILSIVNGKAVIGSVQE
jgi:hypothetical protein